MDIFRLLRYLRLHAVSERNGAAPAAAMSQTMGEPQPALRAELFSAEQMERHGTALAQQHRLNERQGPDLLLARLAANEQVLRDSWLTLTSVGQVQVGQRATPAVEWLLDNHYLVDEQIRIARKHLPRRYSRILPTLSVGPSAGLPRVYDIALEVISHGDGRVDAEGLARFVASYQQVQPLALGELWAIPIMLRLALIENLRRITARVIDHWSGRQLAKTWADRLTETAERDPNSVVLVVADMARSDPPMEGAFVAELARRLQGQSAALALPLTWIEQRLSETGSSIAVLVRHEAQQQAAEQVSVGNSIGSLRFIAAADWADFVEDCSLVERELREDPAAIYANMDFATRDLYRHQIESMARRSGIAEEEVARRAVALAARQAAGSVQAHVGYQLVDQGAPLLEAELGVRRGLLQRLWRWFGQAPLVSYLGLTLVLEGLFAIPLLAAAHAEGWGAGALILLAIPVLLTTGRLALALVNWLISLSVVPQMLPRLDFRKGLPTGLRCLVVVPTLIARDHDVDELLEGLEVRFLANRDDQIHFALLSDFPDAANQHEPLDAALLEAARTGIEALNRKYSGHGAERFFLLHRPRRWSPSEGAWMGHERKRGKLSDLNALLRGRGEGCFELIVGDIRALGDVRYVITLDTDTQLPRDAARQFVAAMAHPLNWPQYDAKRGRVSRGHAILQPRVSISLQSVGRSAYAKLFGNEAGIDPYTKAVSDLYQDLFDEGSFIGKGIYDVDAFELAVAGRLPDERILSHDLIEGCYARSGLLSDVELFEEYPSRYLTSAARQHRWIRGDWQLLPWIFPWAPDAEGRWRRNALSALSRWKIADNLRRSLEPSALLVSLLFGWLGLAQTLSWTVAVLALVLIQPLLAVLLELFQKPPEVALRHHLAVAARSSAQHAQRAVLGLAWLPHEVVYSADAIIRSLWRQFVSHRHQLQWSTSREVERRVEGGLAASYRQMAAAPLVALVCAAALTFLSSPWTCLVALPLLALWMLAPLIAWRISQPPRHEDFEPDAAELRFLHGLSRRIWAFFEHHVGDDDHWLAPDNMQEQPVAVIAHRTSPTNMGLGLLAHLAAYDFGYLSVGRLLDRVGRGLDTMNALPKHRGHFYNWYDTQSLAPLAPRYVSTVDSGNLAGHLLTLRAGLLGLLEAPVVDRRLLSGLSVSLDVLDEVFTAARMSSDLLQSWRSELKEIIAADAMPLAALVERVQQWEEWALALREPFIGQEDEEVGFWLDSLLTQARDTVQELAFCQQLASAQAISGTVSWRYLGTMLAAAAGADADASIEDMRSQVLLRLDQIRRLADLCGRMAVMRFDFLYSRSRNLFSIGYNVDEDRLDAGFYDLLASEARLTNFVVIAQGQLPQEGWFTLGRLLTTASGMPVLLSWSGSLFEYLMPLLVMPSYGGSLLDQTCHAAVARQIEYGQQLGLPWGVSESGYNVLDAQFNYQYRAFGVPGLGLKRGLGEDLVVAPYAAALALMVAPQAACDNLRRLVDAGVSGRYGMYEAADYTPARLPRGHSIAVVRSYMAHHQGMSLLSLANVLLDRVMQRRFAADPQCQATMLLLQERVPRSAAEYLQPSGSPHELGEEARAAETKLRVINDPSRRRPSVQLLSNGRYHVMLNGAGAGYSRRGETAVTRWSEDLTADNRGMFCYLRDVSSGEFWSATHQPTLKNTERHEAIFSDARAEFRVREKEFSTHCEVVVSPEDDIELRRLHISNQGHERRTLELTSYAEVVLATAAADAAHPAFSKLFVQTELVEPLQAIICSRRPRGGDERPPWMCHLLAAHGGHVESVSYETDRARFIGRGRSLIAPAALDPDAGGDARLSNTAGPVLDPIVSIRCRITLDAGESATVDLVTGIGDDRADCLRLIAKYRDRHLADRVFDLAWTHAQVLLRQLNASHADARLYEQMAASVIYASVTLRADSDLLAANRRDQSGLWGQSISGDLPIVLLQIHDQANIDLVRQMVQAHAYWRLKGLTVDLVIWNEDNAGYRQQLQDLILGLITSGAQAALLDRPGGIFVRPAQQLSREDRILTQSVARVVISDLRGSLAEQVHRRWAEPPLPRFDPARLPSPLVAAAPAPARPLALQLENAYGGYSADGSEYLIRLAAGTATPAPWSNVLANPQFGTVISESGSAYSWSENAHEFRLTPWINDPVSDGSGEAIYVRDEDSGHYWSPTPLPCRGDGDYLTRHGFGYSVFEYQQDGIHSELWVYVAIDASVKFSVLKLRNLSGRRRKLSATGYVEWQLGDLREKTAMHVVSEIDPASGALFARNAFLMGFPGRVAFFDVDAPERSVSADRSEFLGRNGSLRAPAAMAQPRLSGHIGAALDPCAAIRAGFELDDGESHELVFRLGAALDATSASQLARRYRGAGEAEVALEAVRTHWRWTLGKVQVRTSEPAIDVLVNGWLMYQVIAARFWARSGYYQSGGAFGFRDQLQDTMAMIHAAPYAARQHLLLSAAHQFVEGDVLHWWHPPQDRGVRTTCSDDYLWLPLAACRYVHITGDTGVLDEQIHYIEGRPLRAGEESYYDLPTPSGLSESLYQHCLRAIKHSERRGSHGLPLMGGGDWNDGMNRVGEQGRGESVWLGFFLYRVLRDFTALARLRGDVKTASHCEAKAAELQVSLETYGWDGAWYRRAYFDDGTPLGSLQNDACRIDSIAQSWSVLSGAATEARQHQAMSSLYEHLVRQDAGLIQLLDPPFDHTELDPGYIKGYLPGVRENGGQYTHGAVWAVMAVAALGDGERAWDLARMINPAWHTDAAHLERYKVEPYVMAADVYNEPPHIGRGGWTWYTGSAGWMYRLLVESLLGLEVSGERLSIRPLLPRGWEGFELDYRFRETDYHFKLQSLEPGASATLSLDGVTLPAGQLTLVDDGLDHNVCIGYPRSS